MRVTKIIQEELGQELEKIGFRSAFQERYVWPYEREKDGIKQMITFLTDRYEKKYIRVLLVGEIEESGFGMRRKKDVG